jgi:hypothetical protein
MKGQMYYWACHCRLPARLFFLGSQLGNRDAGGSDFPHQRLGHLEPQARVERGV